MTMHLSVDDWAIVVGYLIICLGIGFYFTRRAGKSVDEFFVSGRNLPWWLAGTSMVATTFSTDTPLLVTELTRTKGVSGNWTWWCMLLSGMLTVFFFARLWRRSEVITDAEFYELRYPGKAATFLRGFRAIYLGLFINCLIMGTVSLAMGKIGHAILGWEPWWIVFGAGIVTVAYTVTSGLWGVVMTDLPQFIIAMAGSVALACYAVSDPQVGGLSGLFDKVPATTSGLFPDFMAGNTILIPFLVMIGVQWWASWYPGAEPGGGGYIVQRVFACKNERHSLYSTLWFNIAHYALRPWPWILVALASFILINPSELPLKPDGTIDHGYAYPILLRLLPHGMLGLMFCSFLAAYMSTMDTHMNWGASYLINDVYKRFVKKNATEKHYVSVSRILMVILTILACIVSFKLGSQEYAFNLLITIGAGTGLVYILRWFWWRISAWSEISAMIASLVIANLMIFVIYPDKQKYEDNSQWILIINVLATTVVWVVVTFFTSPKDIGSLEQFYRKVRPGGPGWKPLKKRCPDVIPAETMRWNFVGWILGCVLVYAILIGTGYLLKGETNLGLLFLGGALVCIFLMVRLMKQIGWGATSTPGSP